MYYEKLIPLLSDLENKEIEIAGGSVVGMNLATINSLIKYISNLTFGKKKYEQNQEKIKKIYEAAEKLKEKSLNIIDKDKEILEEILKAYKIKKEDEIKYEEICIKAVDFCYEVVETAYETLRLSDKISIYGNKMLSSDFKISKYYAYASIKSAIVNVEINLEAIKDEKFKKEIKEKCNKVLKNSELLMKNNTYSNNI